jgi:hypothetical protein
MLIVQFSSCQLTCILLIVYACPLLQRDKHFVYSAVTHCLNPAIVTPTSSVIPVRKHYHLDQQQCTQLQLFHADMFINQVHVHTNTQVASIQCDATRQHAPTAHKDVDLTCAVFQSLSDWSPLHSFLVSCVNPSICHA